jgi:hypothetical protein
VIGLASRFAEARGHSREWGELNQQQKNALTKNGLTDRKGRILVQE